MSRQAGENGNYTSDLTCVCGAATTAVIESRGHADGRAIRRRRKCLNCGARVTTYECVDHPSVAADRVERVYSKVRALLSSALLELSPAAAAVDPSATDTGTPTTRD